MKKLLYFFLLFFFVGCSEAPKEQQMAKYCLSSYNKWIYYKSTRKYMEHRL